MPAKAKPKASRLSFCFYDDVSIQLIRTILAYESNVRGRTMGQAAAELILGSVSTDDYPPEVRERLDEIAERSRRHAIEKSLEMSQP